ncbi:MAG TPA: cyclic nucleotide-binding domain-containing protein [Thermoanaerobaculia bacterium]|nr:cyclic nucleotide-binding domain-containing protein [Thermoanaerobaculia bacterium]
MDDEGVIRLLADTALGEGLSRDELAQLAARGEVRRVAAAQVLLREGDVRGALLVVLEGEVEVLQQGEGGSHCLVVLGSDSVLGEIGLVRRAAATATVRTTRPSLVFELERGTFERLLAAGDAVALRLAYNLARVLASRLERMNEEAVKLCEKYEQALGEAGEPLGSSRVRDLAAFRTRLSEWSF